MSVNPITVSQLNRYVKSVLESDNNLNNLTVKGEISNLAIRNGHIFMTLKDESASLKAVMFQSKAAYLKFLPEDGMTVIVKGSVSLFERDGSYQLYIYEMSQDGTGKEYLRFLETLEKLQKNGTIDPESRKPIPKMPESIGVITSPSGAAIQDVLSVLKRRYPQGVVYIYPCLVQGTGASESVIKGIEYFNSNKTVDVIIITRGGGSYEDLACFNDENLAYAVKRSVIPIVSAVGHEVDTTIIDYVADLRCPTPSAAAERVSPDITELNSHLSDLRKHINHQVSSLLEVNKNKIKYLSLKCNYNNFMERQSGYLQGLESGIEKYMKSYLNDGFNNLHHLSEMISKTVNSNFKSVTSDFANLKKKSREGIDNYLNAKEKDFSSLAGRLNALSPLKTLSRGYAAIINKDRVQIKSVEELSEKEKIELLLIDGGVDCNVTKIKKYSRN